MPLTEDLFAAVRRMLRLTALVACLTLGPAPPARAIAVHPLAATVFMTLPEGRICPFVSARSCPDMPILRLAVDVTGLVGRGDLSLRVEGQTIGLSRHYRTVLPHGERFKLFDIGIARKSVTVSFLTPPDLAIRPDGTLRSRMTIDSSGLGLKPRQTDIGLRVAQARRPLTVTHRASDDPSGWTCPRGTRIEPTAHRRAPLGTALQLSVDVDDFPPWLDRDIRNAITRKTLDPVNNLSASLQLLGAAAPALTLSSPDGRDLAFALRWTIRQDDRATFFANLRTAGLLAADQSFPDLFLALMTGKPAEAARLAAFLHQAASTAPGWRLADGPNVFSCRGRPAATFGQPQPPLIVQRDMVTPARRR